MSSMSALTAPSDGSTLTAAIYNGNGTTIRNFVNTSCLVNDAAQTLTSTTANQLTVAYDGSNKAIVNVSSGGVVTLTATTSFVVATATSFSAAVTMATTLGVTGAVTAGTALAGSTYTATLTNTDNSNTASTARLLVSVGGSAAGDAQVGFLVTATTAWSVGVDNSDSDAFVVSQDPALGTLNRFKIDTSGGVTIPGTLGVTSDVTVNTNKFTVTASNGDTLVAGTLAVTGAQTFTGATALNGHVTMGTAKTLVTAPAQAGQSGFRISSGTAPSSPATGDFWYDGTNLKFREGAVTRTLTWA